MYIILLLVHHLIFLKCLSPIPPSPPLPMIHIMHNRWDMTLKSTAIKIKMVAAVTITAMASTSKLNWELWKLRNSKICSIFEASYNWHIKEKNTFLLSKMKFHVVTGWCTAKIHHWLLLFYILIGVCFYVVDYTLIAFQIQLQEVERWFDFLRQKSDDMKFCLRLNIEA